MRYDEPRRVWTSGLLLYLPGCCSGGKCFLIDFFKTTLSLARSALAALLCSDCTSFPYARARVGRGGGGGGVREREREKFY